MNRFLRVAVALAVCASALVVAGGATARPQIIIVNSYSGHYEGFFNSAAFGQIATFTMDIAPSRTSIYSGVLASGDVREPFHVAIGPGGGFLAGGTGQSGFLAVGRAQAIAGGASSLSSAAYVLRTPLGLDYGSLRFIQSFRSGDAPNCRRAWREVAPTRPASAHRSRSQRPPTRSVTRTSTAL